MSSPSAYHPDLCNIARVLPRSIFTTRTLPLMKMVTRIAGRRTPDWVHRTFLYNDVSVRVHRPARPTGLQGALLWIHGGGYVIGTAAQDDRLCARFARAVGVPVVAIDYRLAPRYPYPAALEDCYAALTWVSEMEGVDPAAIAIGGASAGGGLAAALALLARDRGTVAPLLQLLVYPMVDDRSSVLPENRDFRLWNKHTNAIGWEAYLGGADRAVAVPARRADLTGVAPAWVGVGSLDPLYSECVTYADRLSIAGVPCALETVKGAFHGFDMVAPKAKVSREFFDSQCAALTEAFSR